MRLEDKLLGTSDQVIARRLKRTLEALRQRPAEMPRRCLARSDFGRAGYVNRRSASGASARWAGSSRTVMEARTSGTVIRVKLVTRKIERRGAALNRNVEWR